MDSANANNTAWGFKPLGRKWLFKKEYYFISKGLLFLTSTTDEIT